MILKTEKAIVMDEITANALMTAEKKLAELKKRTKLPCTRKLILNVFRIV